MARFSVFTLTLLTAYATALQVTPNSPCASFCVDSNDLDFSDPNSSTTGNDDMTCYDSEYTSSPAGQKFQRCISCLEDSTFSQDDETDQLWFLYNLRYTFDYCIFGFPNAKDVASTPCSTETACGELQAALTGDHLEAETIDYSYCSADGGAMGGSAVEKCLACVSASDDQDFLANYIVALDAGCKQQPPAGTLVGLNDTVFSKTRIGAVDPATEAGENDQGAVPMGTIVGIAVGAVVVILAIAGVTFVCCRKRRNRRRLRLEGDRSSRIRPQLGGPNGPASPLSFRCQTHVSPRSPTFPEAISEVTTPQGEKGYYDHRAGFKPYSASPVSPPMTPSAMWPVQQNSAYLSESKASPPQNTRRENTIPALHSITTTTAGPALPRHAHYHSGSPPFSPDDYNDIPPPSTVSTRSTAQLLPQIKPYNPAEYAAGSAATGSGSTALPSLSEQQTITASAAAVSTPESTYTYTSPVSGSTASPLLSRAWEHQRAAVPVWDVPQQRGSSRPNLTSTIGRVAAKGRRFSSNGSSSPVETSQINTVFAAPPTRR